MAILDADGLFYGDWLRRLPLQARLHWPYLYTAANDLGRLELNYRKLANRVYATFPEIPTEADLMGYVREYSDAFLLFVFECNGQLWGQFDTSEKYLPRYKSKVSLESPNPGPAFIEWKNGAAPEIGGIKG